MPTIFNRNALRQDATYWASVQEDGLGGYNFGPSVNIKCRWQQKSQLFRNAEGEEVVATDIVYPDRELNKNGFLAR